MDVLRIQAKNLVIEVKREFDKMKNEGREDAQRTTDRTSETEPRETAKGGAISGAGGSTETGGPVPIGTEGTPTGGAV